jgi:hypothetical protein
MFKRALLSFFLLFLIFKTTGVALAVTMDPPTVGDVDVQTVKQIKISGLDPKTKYYISVSKETSAIPFASFSTVFTDCYFPDSNTEIIKDIGPFSTPGFYKLEIYQSDSNAVASCESDKGAAIVSQDFSVGGPTNDNCCTFLSFNPAYFPTEDVCKKDAVSVPTSVNPAVPTNCSKANTFCEPQSLKCFKTKTQIIVGKICKSKKEKDFDPNKNVECGSTAGSTCDTDPKNPGIATAIGCIHTSFAAFIKDFMTFIIAISGGFAFLMMLLGAYQMLNSAGNPDSLQAGRERFTSAIVGLLFVIFAVLLLQVIGVDILFKGLPGFNR